MKKSSVFREPDESLNVEIEQLKNEAGGFEIFTGA